MTASFAGLAGEVALFVAVAAMMVRCGYLLLCTTSDATSDSSLAIV